MSASAHHDRLTVVVAAFDEAGALPELHRRLANVLDALPRDTGVEGRVLYIDDGSRDDTWRVLQRFAAEDHRVSLLRLSRNFGKEAALTAGLDRIDTGAALILDADGQDPPELIPKFVARWREGYDDVYGTRLEREGESWLKKTTAHAFYRVMQRLSKTPIPTDTGDFRLLSPRALLALGQLRERHRFMKGLFGWVGFNGVAIPYHREPRLAGATKFNFWRLWNFALEGITSFSTAPLRLATYLGVATALVAFAYGSWIVLKALLWGDAVAGWPTMMAVILFLGGVQLIALGLIGEYLGRLYEESKQRPLYLVDVWQPATGVSSVKSEHHPHPGLPLEGKEKRIPAFRAKWEEKQEAAMRTVRQLLESKTPEVFAIAPDVPVIDAIRLMAEKRIGAVLVMQGGRLAGILSERDYARKIVLDGRSSKDTPVRDIMTADVVTVGPGDTVQSCMQIVTGQRIRHLPVLDGGAVVGVISIGDLVKAVIEDQQLELDQLQRYIAS